MCGTCEDNLCKCDISLEDRLNWGSDGKHTCFYQQNEAFMSYYRVFTLCLQKPCCFYWPFSLKTRTHFLNLNINGTEFTVFPQQMLHLLVLYQESTPVIRHTNENLGATMDIFHFPLWEGLVDPVCCPLIISEVISLPSSFMVLSW